MTHPKHISLYQTALFDSDMDRLKKATGCTAVKHAISTAIEYYLNTHPIMEKRNDLKYG